jgi:hypothetical protein
MDEEQAARWALLRSVLSHFSRFAPLVTAEDAPNAAAEGTQPAPIEGSTNASPRATGVKTAEALLPSLSIWPPSQRTRDAVVRRLMQMMAAPSVLSQRYDALLEPKAERAATVVEGRGFRRYFRVCRHRVPSHRRGGDRGPPGVFEGGQSSPP